mmetsp:Transcript_13204/g.23667  ORF Transcript_13204/g.23667 Transcript_13204/m.23667 type:complete len:1292 (+) Transcript_13204:382-4257(+)
MQSEESRKSKRFAKFWRVCARFPGLLLLLFFIVIPGAVVPFFFLTPIIPIQIETDFEAYLRSDEDASMEYEEFRALHKGPEEEGNAGRLLFEGRSLATERPKLEVMYYCGRDCKTIYTEDRLASIRRFEQSFKANIYESSCRKVSGVCAVPESILNYFYPTDLGNGQVRFDGNGDTLMDIDSVLRQIEVSGDYWYTSRNFLSAGGQNPITRSRFKLEFSSTPEWHSYMADSLLPFLQANQELSPDIRVLWHEPGVNKYEITSTISKDTIFGAISLGFVFLVMWFHSRSLFLSLVACGAILLSYPITYVIYTLVLGNEVMMVFNFTSIFVIIGIGADDFFIFSDLWAQSRAFHGFDMADRVRWTWTRAAGATLVTSLTTAASFFANLASAISPIRDFGSFMGVIVLMNYIHIILILPPALVVYEKYFYKMCSCSKPSSTDIVEQEQSSGNETRVYYLGGGDEGDSDDDEAPVTKDSIHIELNESPHSMGHIPLAQSVASCDQQETRTATTVQPGDVQLVLENDKKAPKITGEYRTLVRFFHDRLAPFLDKSRFVLVFLVLGVAIALGVIMKSNLKLSDEIPQIFSKSTNLGMMQQVRKDYFSEDIGPIFDDGETIPTVPVCVGNDGSPVLCTQAPTQSPTVYIAPTTPAPTIAQTERPSKSPTKKPTTLNPTSSPTKSPTTKVPTPHPSDAPSKRPTPEPTASPSTFPTASPSMLPTSSPTRSPIDIKIPAVLVLDDASVFKDGDDFRGSNVPLNGHVSSRGVTQVNGNVLCSNPGQLGSLDPSTTFVLAQAGGSCSFSDKQQNTANAFPSASLLIQEGETNEPTSSQGIYAISVTNALAQQIASAATVILGIPIVVVVTLDHSASAGRRLRTAEEIFPELDQSQLISDKQDNPDRVIVIVPSFSSSDANEVQSYVETKAETVSSEIITPAPTPAPTTAAPTDAPSQTLQPSQAPTRKPSVRPSAHPTKSPTLKPTRKPSTSPTRLPTYGPTQAPISMKLSSIVVSSAEKSSYTLDPSFQTNVMRYTCDTGSIPAQELTFTTQNLNNPNQNATVTVVNETYVLIGMSNDPEEYYGITISFVKPPVCECNGHGECAENATHANPTCRCYDGWTLESECSELDPNVGRLDDSQVAITTISWLKTRVASLASKQEAFVHMCEMVRNQTRQFNNSLEVRRLKDCIMEDFKNALNGRFPIEDEAQFEQEFRAYIMAHTGTTRDRTTWDKDGQLTSFSMEVLTNIDKLIPAAGAHEYYVLWEAFVHEQDEQAIQTSFLWARAETELAIVNGTLFFSPD